MGPKSRLLLLLALTVLLTDIAVAQKKRQVAAPSNAPCESPNVRGLRLGMTADEVGEAVKEKLYLDDKGFGEQSAHLSGYQKGDPTRFTVVKFLDGRLYEIYVVYNESINWKTVEEFRSTVAERLDLPKAWQRTRFGYKITCAGFSVEAFKILETRGPILKLTDEKALSLLAQRKQEDQKKKKETFTP